MKLTPTRSFFPGVVAVLAVVAFLTLSATNPIGEENPETDGPALQRIQNNTGGDVRFRLWSEDAKLSPINITLPNGHYLYAPTGGNFILEADANLSKEFVYPTRNADGGLNPIHSIQSNRHVKNEAVDMPVTLISLKGHRRQEMIRHGHLLRVPFNAEVFFIVKVGDFFRTGP